MTSFVLGANVLEVCHRPSIDSVVIFSTQTRCVASNCKLQGLNKDDLSRRSFPMNRPALVMMRARAQALLETRQANTC